MSKHTKGPWTRDEYGQILTPDGRQLLVCGVAMPCARPSNWEEVEANARLIAAAPCMYEALKYALQEIESLPQWPDEVNNARHAIIEALKKATGDEG